MQPAADKCVADMYWSRGHCAAADSIHVIFDVVVVVSIDVVADAENR